MLAERFHPFVVPRRRAGHSPNGAPLAENPGTNTQLVANTRPSVSKTQWPAVQTTLRLRLFRAVPEQT